MTRREAFIIVCFLIFPVFAFGLLAIIALIIALLPRAYTRQLRRRLARVVMWQWIKNMKLSRFFHDLLWSDGNGEPYDYSKIG